MHTTPLELRGAAGTELPCVWVSAGVLAYRACDRAYECESCPLYQALRGEGDAVEAGAAPPCAGAPADDPVARTMTALGAGCTLHLDRAYSAEGLWLAPDPAPSTPGVMAVGLDDYTLRLLQPLDGVVMPRAGVWLGHGAPCVWLQRGRLAIAVRSPVAGEVVEVHSCPSLAVPASPDAAAPPPQWWFRLKPHESVANAAGLYRNDALLAWFLARVRAVRDHVAGAVASAEADALGTLLNDGGMPNLDLEMVLGRERFEALVGTLFPL